MKNFGRYVLIMIIFFFSAIAYMQQNRRRCHFYGSEGRIVEKAAETVRIAAGAVELTG